jgi:hypothetical protein
MNAFWIDLLGKALPIISGAVIIAVGYCATWALKKLAELLHVQAQAMAAQEKRVAVAKTVMAVEQMAKTVPVNGKAKLGAALEALADQGVKADRLDVEAAVFEELDWRHETKAVAKVLSQAEVAAGGDKAGA